MKTIIAGSRSITNYAEICDAVSKSGIDITEIVSGTARGVDRLGEIYGSKNSIPVKKFPANWGFHGRKAGFIRNREMAQYADALIAIHDGKSRGTTGMIGIAKQERLVVYVKVCSSCCAGWIIIS